MTYEHIIYAKEDYIATITLNRPEKMNAVTGRTMGELAQAIEEV